MSPQHLQNSEQAWPLNRQAFSVFRPKILFKHSQNPTEKRNLEYLRARFHEVMNK